MLGFSINKVKTAFLFKFWFLNYKFTSKQRETINWQFIFVSMLICIPAVIKSLDGIGKLMILKVVFILLIYTTITVKSKSFDITNYWFPQWVLRAERLVFKETQINEIKLFLLSSTFHSLSEEKLTNTKAALCHIKR